MRASRTSTRRSVAAVDLAIDGGELTGLPSTVVDLTAIEDGGGRRILREGALSSRGSPARGSSLLEVVEELSRDELAVARHREPDRALVGLDPARSTAGAGSRTRRATRSSPTSWNSFDLDPHRLHRPRGTTPTSAARPPARGRRPGSPASSPAWSPSRSRRRSTPAPARSSRTASSSKASSIDLDVVRHGRIISGRWLPELPEDFQTAPLAEVDPEIAEVLRRELERQQNDAGDDRLGELRPPGGARRRRLGAHQQVRRGLPGPPLLRRLRGGRRRRAAGDRPGARRCSAPSTPTSSRTPAPRPTTPPTWRSSSPATRSWAWPSTTAATSRTG